MSAARVAAVALALTVAGAALADPPGAPRSGPAAPTPAVTALVDAATRHFASGDYRAAAAALRAAHAREPQPRYLYGLAQAERLGGDCAAAIRSYEAFLRTAPPTDQADSAQQNMLRCQAELIARGANRSAAGATSLPAGAWADLPAPWYRDRLGGVLCAGGAAVIITGAVLLAHGRALVTDAAGAAAYDAYDDLASRALAWQRAGGATLIAGGVVLVAGVARYLLRPGPRRARVTAAADHRGAVVGLEGAF